MEPIERASQDEEVGRAWLPNLVFYVVLAVCLAALAYIALLRD